MIDLQAYLRSLTPAELEAWIAAMGGPYYERLTPAATQADADEDKEGTYR